MMLLYTPVNRVRQSSSPLGMVIPLRGVSLAPDQDLTCFSGKERDDEPVRHRQPRDAPA
jgi:hypothetical protein